MFILEIGTSLILDVGIPGQHLEFVDDVVGVVGVDGVDDVVGDRFCCLAFDATDALVCLLFFLPIFLLLVIPKSTHTVNTLFLE